MTSNWSWRLRTVNLSIDWQEDMVDLIYLQKTILACSKRLSVLRIVKTRNRLTQHSSPFSSLVVLLRKMLFQKTFLKNFSRMAPYVRTLKTFSNSLLEILFSPKKCPLSSSPSSFFYNASTRRGFSPTRCQTMPLPEYQSWPFWENFPTKSKPWERGREIERDLFLLGCGVGEVGRKREWNFFVRMWRGRKGKGREGEGSSTKVIKRSRRKRRNPFFNNFSWF